MSEDLQANLHKNGEEELEHEPQKAITASTANEVNPPAPENADASKNDPYAYLERGEFSSEKFKVEIKNLPKYYGVSEFRKLLNDKLKLGVNKLKTPRRNSPYAFACFRSEVDRDRAIEVITATKWKGKELTAIKAKPAPDPLVKKRKDDEEAETMPQKKQKLEVPQEEQVKNSTIPLWNMPYEEQLKYKQEEAKKVLRDLTRDLSHNATVKEWLKEQQAKNDGLACELQEIRHSDATDIDGYRNKCEFSVGIDEETNLKTVGFRVGSYVNGAVGVAPVCNLKHIPESMKIAVESFQEFVRSSSLEVFNQELQTGHFRQFTVRTAEKQLMVIVGIHPQNLSEEELKDFREKLTGFFSTEAAGAGKRANVTSLYYQFIVKKSLGGGAGANAASSKPQHLWGSTHIQETILGLKFQISPEAFFQINTKAAEVLYKSAIEFAEPNENSTVLDVCCGTGTIGLCFSETCRQVLGLEVIPEAIADAKKNAEINGITNSKFFTGKAEEILGNVCFQARDNEIIAVVDPPRAGLHLKAVLQLRKISAIKKVVFISCNPKAAYKNFADLGRSESKTVHGEPFVPVRAVAVDMFPHTRHYELLVCFQRLDSLLSQK